MMVFTATIFALVFVAVCSGQYTTWTPKSYCGMEALKCYIVQRDAMEDKIEATNFADACLIYKSIITCMASIGDCQADSDYIAVRAEVDGDQYGICGVDGSLQSCGYDVQVCFTELNEILSNALVRNFTNACLEIPKFIDCSNNVIKQNECPDSFVAKIKYLQQQVEDDKNPFGCRGPCEQAISFCNASAEPLRTDQSILDVNLTNYCQSAVKVYNCISNLTTSAVCTLAPQGYLKAIAQNELANIGDICNKDGYPSVCVLGLAKCAADFSKLKQGDSVFKVCNVSSEFLECINNLPCVSALLPLVTNFRNTIETFEIEQICPSVGSCNKRWQSCAEMDVGLVNMIKANQQIDCKLASQANKCFDYVTNDPICINVSNIYIAEKQDIDMLYKTQCGGSKGTD